MPADFSHVSYDLLIEILGYLPALDIIRLRRVCRPIFQASKERSVWIIAFQVAQCPIPDVNVNTMSTEAIENLLVRMEIVDAKWSGIRPTVPRKIEGSKRYFFKHCISMPPYVLFIDIDPLHRECARYQWYRADDLKTLITQYQHEKFKYCHATDPSGSTLNIAYMENPDGSPEQEDRTTRLLKFVKFEISKEEVISKTVEREILWTNFTVPHHGANFELTLLNGYVITQPQGKRKQSWPISLLHIETGKTYTCPSYWCDRDDGYEQYIASSTTSSYLVQRNESTFFFCKFPSKEEIETSTAPLTLRLTHSGSFSSKFDFAHLFPRSASTFIIIGLTKWTTYEGDYDLFLRLRFITVKLSSDSPACDMHEDYCYEAKNLYSFESYALAQCSSTSRFTIGVLNVSGFYSPTHAVDVTNTPPTSTAPILYNLGVRIDFGVKGYSSPKIDVVEIDLVPLKDRTDRAFIYDFNPYIGQAIVDVREMIPSVQNPPGYNKGLVVTDYASSD